jgi:hypothetical protein
MNKFFYVFYFNSLKLYVRFALLALIVSATFYSCKSHKKISLNNGKCLLDFKNAHTLASNLKKNEFRFDRINAKLSAEAEIDSTSASFSVSLRMKKDSIIWMSLSKLGIEGARVLITKDSVKFIKRPLGSENGKYFVGDYAYISKMLNTDLDFELLQALLVGNRVEFYDEDEKIKPGIDNCQYMLGTIRKNKLKKVMEKGKELKEPAQSIYLIPESYKIARIIFYEFATDRSFEARFSDFEVKDSTQLFPMKMNYFIKAQKNVKINLTYNKVVLNEEQSFPFKIPENYETITIKEKK